MGMNILQACEDFFITGIRMMVGFRFLFFTRQNPVLPKASAVMRMFFERTGQVSIFIKAVPGMGVLFNFTYNLRVYIVAVFRVAVAFSFFQAAGQFILIAAVIMLMFFDPACSGLLKCDCGKKECIGCARCPSRIYLLIRFFNYVSLRLSNKSVFFYNIFNSSYRLPETPLKNIYYLT